MAAPGAPELAWPFVDPYPGTARSYRRILQPFGVTTYTAEPVIPGTTTHFHSGDDFAVPSGTPILAAAGGTVRAAGPNPTNTGYGGGYGVAVALDHGSGLWTVYGHLTNGSVAVAVDSSVKQGDQLALSDSTGNSSGPHLHFGVNTMGDPWGIVTGFIDPMTCLTDNPDASSLPGPSAAPGYITPEQAVWYARGAGIPENQLTTCVAIAMAESQLQISASNPSGATGIWQIMPSSAPSFKVSDLLTNPAINAKAMASIYNAEPASGKWHDWETYGNPAKGVPWGQGAYRQYLNRAKIAVAATPPGSSPITTGAGPLGEISSAAAVIQALPQLPVQQLPLTPVIIDRSKMVYRDGYEPKVGIQIGPNATTLEVVTAQWSDIAYRVAGTWQATMALSTFDSPDGQKAYDLLLARTKTQATIRAGYVPIGAATDLGRLPPVFAGFATISSIDDSTGLVTLSGPDMSGLFSDQSATSSSLDAFMNTPVDKAIKKIVTAHNAVPSFGLSVVTDSMAGTVGGVYGTNQVQTRTPIRTEWDIITTLSEAEGCVCYFRGTVLYVVRPKARTDAVHLPFRKAGTPEAPAILPPRFRPQPHIKRDFFVVASAYDTRQGHQIVKVAGNTDSPDILPIYMAPNTPADRLKKKADSALATFVATELQADLALARPTVLDPAQPLVLDYDGPHYVYRTLTGPHHRYYAVMTTNSYGRDTGLGVALTLTVLPPNLQNDATAGSVSF